MIVFGARASGYFFSHIPMFHAPHDVQVVFPTELEAAPSNLADGLYTFKPDDARLSLDDVVLGTRLKIVGMLFRGNFEQNGKPIGKVTARVHSPLKPLTQALGTSGSGEVTYVAFGKLDATYLIHRLSRAPDFDQVIRCDFTHSGITAEMLRDGVMLMFPDKTHPVEERLRAGKHQATMRDGTKVFFTVETVFSTLVGPDFTQSLDP